ncbi:MAG: metal-dependent hydrolase [Rhodothermales bacterium]|nr:metal-dependent hydrolase [Rhodothermales bacterium]MBO6780815.1 metal-dependent hydrolase [Rhodothermales bacterium]
MPFTPFHLGLAAVIKAATPHRFSFLIFAGSQVLMDLEVAIRMVKGTELLHGMSHTVPGALVIGAVAALIGRPVTQFVMDIVDGGKVSKLAAWSGAMVGTLSHVLLDAFMHADMEPWWPLGESNALLGMVQLDLLHALLGWGLVIGGVAVVVRRRLAP